MNGFELAVIPTMVPFDSKIPIEVPVGKVVATLIRGWSKLTKKHCHTMVSQAGVEPATYRLGGGCSIH